MHTLPPLKFAFNAVEQAVDALTMEIHHDKHHAAYVTNLNKALEAYPDLQGKSVDALISEITAVPEPIRTAVRNTGGGQHGKRGPGDQRLQRSLHLVLPKSLGRTG